MTILKTMTYLIQRAQFKPNNKHTECGGDGTCWGCSGSGVIRRSKMCSMCNGVCPACSGTGMMATSQNG